MQIKRQGASSLSSVAILGGSFFVVGGCPMHYRTPVLYHPYTPSRDNQMAKHCTCLLGSGIASFVNHFYEIIMYVKIPFLLRQFY